MSEKGAKQILEGTELVLMNTDELDAADRRWAVSWPGERLDKAFQASVRQMGVIRPLWALPAGGASALPVVVDGFRRLAAATAVGVGRVPVVLLDEGIPEENIFLTRCFDIAGRLSPVEASRLAEKLRSQFGIADDELAKEFLPLWGMGNSSSVLNKLRELERLQEPVARWCVENKTGLRDAGLWARLSREAQRAMLVLVRAFKPGGNLLRGYLELAGEISLREGVSVEEILADSRIHKLMSDPQGAASGGRETVHRVLLERRYPILSDLRGKLKLLKGELGLDGPVSVEPPRLFEGGRYTAEFEFGSPAELEQVAKRLLDAARSGKAGALFRLLGAPESEEQE
jgi:hypothetical protein